MRIISDKKIQTFRDRLKQEKLGGAIFLCSGPIHDFNIEYFAGLRQTKFYAFSCLLLIQEELTLIVTALECDRAKKEAEADEIINLRDYDNSLTKILKEKLKKIESLGIIERIFPYKLYRKFKRIRFQDIEHIVSEIRGVKESKEIGMIKKSCKIANHGIGLIKEMLSRKITEKELALNLEQELIKKGADEVAFPTVVTSGKRSAFIHPEPSFSDKNIGEGLGLVDFGARYKGYCSDVTVPFILGKHSEKQKKIIETVQDAYESSIETLQIGIPTWKIHEVAENVIKKNGFEFKHSLGHGLGLNVHDLPNISPKPKAKEELKEWKEIKLKEGMVFTIEPGVYVPGVGGSRLENNALMTKKGPKILTESNLIIKR